MLARLAALRPASPALNKEAIFEALQQDLLTVSGLSHRDDQAPGPYLVKARAIAARVVEQGEEPMAVTAEIYLLVQELPGRYEPVAPLPFQGVLKPAAAAAARARKREEAKNSFIQALAAILPAAGIGEKPEQQPPIAVARAEAEEAAALIIPGAASRTDSQQPDQQPEAFMWVEDKTLAVPAVTATYR
jgi:hypothetical protein